MVRAVPTIVRVSSSSSPVRSFSESCGTRTPRWPAGRASMAVSQRSRCGSPSVATPDQRWVRTQHQLAMSAMPNSPARYSLSPRRVEHPEEAARLVLVAGDDGPQLLRPIAEEHVGLAHHGADAAHLEHEPLQRARAALRVGGQQAAGPLGEVDEDGAGFEHGEVPRVVIDDGGDAAVRVDAEVVRRFLLAFAEIQGADVVGEAELFEGDGGLPAVGRGGGVECDHGRPPRCHARALGRTLTRSYQPWRWRHSPGIFTSVQPAKSTAASAVASVTLHSGPAT